MNIIVLCGGLSSERDVSLTSGSKIAAALRSRGHRAVLVDVFFGYKGKYSSPADIFSAPYDDSAVCVSESIPDIEAVKKSRTQDNNSIIGDNVIEICRAADIVFMALHGAEGENGKIQALFDLMDIKYTGCGYLGSAIAMNKPAAKSLMAQNGILPPRGITLSRGKQVPPPPHLPCVVKPCSGGSSVGTSIAQNEEEYLSAVELSFRYDDCGLAEEYIKGRECDVGVIGGAALPVIEICPKSGFYDYKNKYQAGMTDEYCPADLPDETTRRFCAPRKRSSPPSCWRSMPVWTSSSPNRAAFTALKRTPFPA
jgi:D-alanine-D-alanine ligase